MYSLSFGYWEKWVAGVVPLALISFALFFVGVFLTPAALATDGSETPSCPFDPAVPGRTIVMLDKRLLPDLECTAIQGPVILLPPLPAGTYDISLASYDAEHPEERNEGNESWFLVLENMLGMSVATTSAIDDLPHADENISRQVNDNLVLTEDVARLSVRHAVYLTDPADFDSPNSITAVCAAFDAKEIPEPPTGPFCGNGILELEIGEMCDDENTMPGDGCSAQCTLETLMCEDTGEEFGWYGEYFNYSSAHPDMNLPTEEWGEPFGDPLSASSTWNADWYK